MRVAVATVRQALEAATDAFRAAGVDTPALDAELLLADALARDRAWVTASPEAEIHPMAGRTFAASVRRRVAREPVAYILGRKGFRRIELAVDRRALIPRPETELLVEVALEVAPRTVLDVGTGSGAVALAIADELPRAKVTAADISAAALELARSNAVRLGLADRVEFAEGTVPPGRFGLAVANLPYVSEAEWDGLQPEITRYEPRSALVGGPDGLGVIRAVVLRLDADVVALEVGEGQALEVGRIVESAGWSHTEVRRDLAGIERVVVGRR